MSSDDPLRLRDDPHVSEELRADLARSIETPGVDLDVPAELAKLSAAIAAGAVVAKVGGGAAAAGGALAAKTSLPMAKIVTWGLSVIALGGAVTYGSVVALSDRAPTAPANATSASVAPLRHVASAAPTAPAAASPSATTEEAPPADEAPPTAKGAAEPASTSRAGSARPRVSPSSSAAATTASERLAEETADLVRLRSLASADPAGALAAADDGQRRFASGAFGEEREAIAIRALASLGRQAEARSRLERFAARYPKSVYLSRLREGTR